jgi:dihydrofolate synthase/folylpolyglutamate synthase
MLANKDAAGFLAPFAATIDTLVALPVPGHEHHGPAALREIAIALGIPNTAQAASIGEAVAQLATTTPRPATVLIAGSLYLAGEVLKANDELPD